MARILLLAGGCRGRALAAALREEGHALRITTRSHARSGAIEAAGAECWVGTPERIATLRGALDGVTIACWLLASARGSEQQLLELHTRRLEFFLGEAIDTTMRGFVYEARGASASARALAAGEEIVARACALNAIPVAYVRADPRAHDAWLRDASSAVSSLLAPS